MTRRERVIRSITFQQVDKVPYNVSLTSNMLKRLNEYTGAEDSTKLFDNHVLEISGSKPEIPLGNERFRDEFGVVWNRSGVDKDIGVVEHYLLSEIEDVDSLALPPVDEAYVRSAIETGLKTRGDRFVVASIGFSLFERAWTLRGMENLLCDMLLEPEYVEKLLNKIVERNLKIVDIFLSYDEIDCVYFGDDWGQQKGLIMGPECWHTFIEPQLRKMYSRVHEGGKFVAQHSCGDVREVMDTLVEIGLNVYQTFQPEIYGLDYAKKLKGKLAIFGGVSTQQALPCKTPEEIRQITRDLLKAFEYTGLIAAPTHAVPGDVPPENLLAMRDELDRQTRA